MLIENMPDAEYHASTRLSSSMLKEMRHSSAHCYGKFLDPDRKPQEDKPAFVFGRALHTSVLEPDLFDEQFIQMPKGIDKRTKAGKELWASWQEEHGTKQIIKEEDLDAVTLCAKSVMTLPISKILQREDALHEVTIHWEEDGIECRVRIDTLIPPCGDFPAALAIDLKSAQDASIKGFERSAFNFGYPIQAGWYQRGIMAHFKTTAPAPFIFLAVEKSAPYCATPYRASEAFCARGWEDCETYLEEYKQCTESGIWPGYSKEIIELDLPGWA